MVTVIERSVEGWGRGAKAEIPTDRVINGRKKVAVLCFGGNSSPTVKRGQRGDSCSEGGALVKGA